MEEGQGGRRAGFPIIFGDVSQIQKNISHRRPRDSPRVHYSVHRLTGPNHWRGRPQPKMEGLPAESGKNTFHLWLGEQGMEQDF